MDLFSFNGVRLTVPPWWWTVHLMLIINQIFCKSWKIKVSGGPYLYRVSSSGFGCWWRAAARWAAGSDTPTSRLCTVHHVGWIPPHRSVSWPASLNVIFWLKDDSIQSDSDASDFLLRLFVFILTSVLKWEHWQEQRGFSVLVCYSSIKSHLPIKTIRTLFCCL